MDFGLESASSQTERSALLHSINPALQRGLQAMRDRRREAQSQQSGYQAVGESLNALESASQEFRTAFSDLQGKTPDSGRMEKLQESARSFVVAFNAAQETIGSLTQTPRNGRAESGGPLFHDHTVRSIGRELNDALESPLSSSQTLRSMADLGFSTSGRGQPLALDEERFRAALQADPGGAAAVAVGTAQQVEHAVVARIEPSSGDLFRKDQGLRTAVSSLDESIAKAAGEMSRRESELLHQYEGLAQALSAFQTPGTPSLQTLLGRLEQSAGE